MPSFTTRFGLLKIENGQDPFQLNRKFFTSDRDLMDVLLWLALSGHVHDGAAGNIDAPVTAPVVTLSTTGGQIAADARLWYTYTLVNDLTLVETGPAPVAYIDTPSRVTRPEAPTLAWGSLGGQLLPGQYTYVLSAYTDYITNTTEANRAVGVIIQPGTTTNRVIITLPDLPVGATGFNIYRREPGGRNYQYLDSVDMTVATPPDEYVDDGTVEEDCDTIAPTRNTTNSTNSVTITLPADIPALPDGYHWKIYRTVNEGDWSGSLLQDVVEETFEASGIIITAFVDGGFETTNGEPPSGTFDFASPEKINLSDAAHVTGYLPMGRVSAFPVVVELFFPGIQTEGAGEAQWPCPFDDALVVSAMPALGRGSSPAAQDLIADVVVGRGTTPVFTSVYAAEADMPTIDVGENKMTAPAPATGTLVNRSMVAGDVLSADIIQEGGSSTPTDEDLTIVVLLYVRVGSEDVSQTWP